ncbi:ACN9-domain-containing protein [Polychaeton citri CBS 116435]|uniref:Succinate dehydrogenase assembly factor 3 n=1 Tax=Polychaeton citri CBS 116435 TaxID=1314669 RepID=A0A9P4Q1G7_9PEZI|nr:ACN9-domain-containing protein [Polychaeton citri CBS 116435]
MRQTARLLATASSVGAQTSSSLPSRTLPLALLPPIPLYRRILRSHRKCLDHEMRVLGDKYVKSEFHAHREVENPVHIIGFLTEWQMYAQHIEGESWRGEKMDKAKIDKMSDEQLGQMYELMRTIREEELREGGSFGTGNKSKGQG